MPARSAISRFQVAACPGQGGDGRYGNVVAEQSRRRAGGPAAAVEDDVIDPRFQGEVDIGLDVLRRHFHPHRNAAGPLAHPVGKSAIVGRGGELFERGRRDGGLSLGQLFPCDTFLPFSVSVHGSEISRRALAPVCLGLKREPDASALRLISCRGRAPGRFPTRERLPFLLLLSFSAIRTGIPSAGSRCPGRLQACS